MNFVSFVVEFFLIRAAQIVTAFSAHGFRRSVFSFQLKIASMPVLPKPLFLFLVVRHGIFYQFPEAGRMVHLQEMCQLVNDDVVADRIGHQHEPPVQTDEPFRRTRSPTPPLIANADLGNHESMSLRQFV